MSGPPPDVLFDEFVSDCATRLMRTAYLLCGNRHVAEDLLQTTMMRTARRWSAACSAPEAYARAVLVNLVREEARRRRRRVEEVLTGSECRSGDGERPAPPDHAERFAERDAILRALSVLPQRQREVVVLRFYADLSVNETAAAIGASPGTVTSYTSRALARLRELLTEPYGAGATRSMSEVAHERR